VQVARTTLGNVRDFAEGRPSPNEVRYRPDAAGRRWLTRHSNAASAAAYRRSSRAVTPAMVSLP
jgi:hypothetical protein